MQMSAEERARGRRVNSCPVCAHLCLLVADLRICGAERANHQHRCVLCASVVPRRAGDGQAARGHSRVVCPPRRRERPRRAARRGPPTQRRPSRRGRGISLLPCPTIPGFLSSPSSPVAPFFMLRDLFVRRIWAVERSTRWVPCMPNSPTSSVPLRPLQRRLACHAVPWYSRWELACQRRKAPSQQLLLQGPIGHARCRLPCATYSVASPAPTPPLPVLGYAPPGVGGGG